MFDPEFFETLKAATDAVFFIPGVDRPRVQSIFTPNVRYMEVVEEGIEAGNVIDRLTCGLGTLVPDDFRTGYGTPTILVSGEDLFDSEFAKQSSHNYLKTLWQIASGIADIHEAGIIHRDN